MTIEETAKYLKLSVATIYKYVSNAAIPVCKKGKRLYFSTSELDNWIKSAKKLTNKETANEIDNFLSRRAA